MKSDCCIPKCIALVTSNLGKEMFSNCHLKNHGLWNLRVAATETPLSVWTFKTFLPCAEPTRCKLARSDLVLFHLLSFQWYHYLASCKARSRSTHPTKQHTSTERLAMFSPLHKCPVHFLWCETVPYWFQKARNDFSNASTTTMEYAKVRILQTFRWLFQGDTVAIFAANSLDYPVIMNAFIALGATVTQGSPRSTESEMRWHLLDSGAKFVVIDGDAVPRLPRLSQVERVFSSTFNVCVILALKVVSSLSLSDAAS